METDVLGNDDSWVIKAPVINKKVKTFNTNHSTKSFIKSSVRILGYVALVVAGVLNNSSSNIWLIVGAGVLILAEVLGVWEEL